MLEQQGQQRRILRAYAVAAVQKLNDLQRLPAVQFCYADAIEEQVGVAEEPQTISDDAVALGAVEPMQHGQAQLEP